MSEPFSPWINNIATLFTILGFFITLCVLCKTNKIHKIYQDFMTVDYIFWKIKLNKEKLEYLIKVPENFDKNKFGSLMVEINNSVDLYCGADRNLKEKVSKFKTEIQDLHNKVKTSTLTHDDGLKYNLAVLNLYTYIKADRHRKSPIGN